MVIVNISFHPCHRLTKQAFEVKLYHVHKQRRTAMKRIKTIETRNLKDSASHGGCGECQTSCQSACKTSCGVANQKCENEKK